MKPNNPGVYFPPSLMYILIFFVGEFLQSKITITPLFHAMERKAGAGMLFLVVGLIFVIRSIMFLSKSETTILPSHPNSKLVTTGPFSFTRNPMYLGMNLLYIAVTCIWGGWWQLLLLPIVIFFISYYVVKKEEKYLSDRFGQEYLDYKNEVKRWL